MTKKGIIEKKDLCPNKELCGSCKWSDLPYKDQLQQKLDQINSHFLENNVDVVVNDIKSAEETSHYRNRMDFIINFQGLMGLREKGKWWKTIDNHTCFISDEKIEDGFDVIYAWIKEAGLSFYDRKADKGFLRYAVIRATTLGEVMVIMVTSSPKGSEDEENIRPAFEDLAKRLDKLNVTSLIWSINETKSDTSFGTILETISGENFIMEEINGFKYKITPNAFFQTNSHGAKILQDLVMEYAGAKDENTKDENTKSGEILDLYCGSGFFTFPLATIAKKITGIEIVEEAIEDAKKNLELNLKSGNTKLKNAKIEFLALKAEDYAWENINADIVLVDPPRVGLHKNVIEKLLEKSPKKIIYVSCNYKNFAKEYSELKRKYKITKISAVDMFPHTPHVELVILLEKFN